VKIFARRGNRPDFVTTTRQGWESCFLVRTVRRGLSRRTVSAPTKIASQPALIFWTSFLACGPVIHLFPGTAKDPSKVIANFRITQGCWVRVQKK
jgi:hypothetical protein